MEICSLNEHPIRAAFKGFQKAFKGSSEVISGYRMQSSVRCKCTQGFCSPVPIAGYWAQPRPAPVPVTLLSSRRGSGGESGWKWKVKIVSNNMCSVHLESCNKSDTKILHMSVLVPSLQRRVFSYPAELSAKVFHCDFKLLVVRSSAELTVRCNYTSFKIWFELPAIQCLNITFTYLYVCVYKKHTVFFYCIFITYFVKPSNNRTMMERVKKCYLWGGEH